MKCSDPNEGGAFMGGIGASPQRGGGELASPDTPLFHHLC